VGEGHRVCEHVDPEGQASGAPTVQPTWALARPDRAMNDKSSRFILSADQD